MSDEINADDEITPEDIGGPGRVPWSVIIISFLLLFAHLPVGFVLGFCTFGVNPLSVAALSQLVFWISFYVIAVDLVLVRPVTLVLFPLLKSESPAILRVYLILALLCPPLFSFGYYRGGIKDLMDFHDLFLMVFPAVAIAATLFEVFRRRYLFSLFLGLSTVLPIFLINDVLSAFLVPVSYFSTGGGFYLLRTFLPVIAVWFVLFSVFTPWRSPVGRATLSNLGYGFLGLAIYTFVQRTLIPAGVAMSRQESFKDYVAIDPWWLVYLGIVFFLARRTQLGYKLLFVVGSGIILFSITKLSFFLWNPNTTFWDLGWFANQLCVLGIAAWLLLVLPGSKGLFSKELTLNK